MTEHTHTWTGWFHGWQHESTVALIRWEGDGPDLPDIPDGVEVTVTWTEPPEPTGRWVVSTNTASGLPRAMWRDDRGNDWNLVHLATRIELRERAEAALVDLIESDHLPHPQHSVDQIVTWMRQNGYPHGDDRYVIRGTLDAIVALAQGHDDE